MIYQYCISCTPRQAEFGASRLATARKLSVAVDSCHQSRNAPAPVRQLRVKLDPELPRNAESRPVLRYPLRVLAHTKYFVLNESERCESVGHSNAPTLDSCRTRPGQVHRSIAWQWSAWKFSEGAGFSPRPLTKKCTSLLVGTVATGGQHQLAGATCHHELSWKRENIFLL